MLMCEFNPAGIQPADCPRGCSRRVLELPHNFEFIPTGFEVVRDGQARGNESPTLVGLPRAKFSSAKGCSGVFHPLGRGLTAARAGQRRVHGSVRAALAQQRDPDRHQREYRDQHRDQVEVLRNKGDMSK